MKAFTGSERYIASEELLSSVEVARALGTPLLIKGAPGTGKPQLAQAVADAMD